MWPLSPEGPREWLGCQRSWTALLKLPSLGQFMYLSQVIWPACRASKNRCPRVCRLGKFLPDGGGMMSIACPQPYSDGTGQPVSANGVWSSGGSASRCESSGKSYTV